MAKIDPNKHSKNANIHPESRLSLLLAALRMGLMLVGIFGIAFELFHDNGWLSKLLANIFNSLANMLLTALVIFGLWLFNRWISKPKKSGTSKISDIPMYAMMAVGGYYLYRLLTAGSF